MPNAYVIVTGTPSDPEDEEVPGVYLVEVRPEAPANLVEETALETFHVNIGIEEVDDFAIRVVDGSGRPFPGQISDSHAREKHPLESWGEFQGGLNEDDIPFAVPATGRSPSP